tara:strand:- start:1038 stop:1364 length:327 start_codon:yes stop_codon:yes gene_type:complete
MRNNPFDVPNYVSQIDWSKNRQAHKIAIQQTAVVNRQRASGIEPSSPYSANGAVTEPEKFAIDMPKLAKYVRPSRKKKMTDCKHEWLTVAEQPLYKCNECGTFMRVEK